MVADDVGQGGVLHTALHANQVVETFVLNGVLGGLALGKESGKFGGHACGVNHLVLGIAGVHADTRDFYAGRGSVEVFKLQFAQFAAVHRVGPFATETLHIEFVRAQADFLVGIEGHADAAVLDFGMLLEIGHGLYDFGDARLVVGTQQGVAVGHDDVLAHVVEQFGKLLSRGHDASGFVQHDVLAVVIANNAGLHVLARAVGAGVHVRDETDGGNSRICVGGQCGVEVAIVVKDNVLQSQFGKFVLQVASQGPLLFRARRDACFVGRLRVEADVLQKSFYNIH